MEFVINITLYYILIGILLFGSILIYRMLPHDRIVMNFIKVLSIMGFVYFLDSLLWILDKFGHFSIPGELDYKNILLGAASQLLFQHFIYTLLFSRQSARKWTIILSIPLLMLIIGAWLGDYLGLFSQFTPLCFEAQPLTSLLSNPLFIISLAILVIQITYSLVIIIFTLRLIPIYQEYIERTQSNAIHNLVWVNELCRLYFLTFVVYIIDAIFATIFSALLYFGISIAAYMRFITLFLHDYTPGFNIKCELYDRIGIRWSLHRLWYITAPTMDQQITENRSDFQFDEFDEFEEWLHKSRAYTDHNFSFSNVSAVFTSLTYKSLDDMLHTRHQCNFQAYIRSVRIEEAIRIMNDPALNNQIKSIAHEVGFDSSSSFARAFKATKGVTASEWRAKHQHP